MRPCSSWPSVWRRASTSLGVRGRAGGTAPSPPAQSLPTLKIDPVDYDEGIFNQIVAEFSEFAAHLAFDAVVAIPISAPYGDNVRQRSRKTPWYRGRTLLEHL